MRTISNREQAIAGTDDSSETQGSNERWARACQSGANLS